MVMATFEKLEMLSEQLKLVKPELIAAPVADIASNTDLNNTFELVANLRNTVVSASE